MTKWEIISSDRKKFVTWGICLISMTWQNNTKPSSIKECKKSHLVPQKVIEWAVRKSTIHLGKKLKKKHLKINFYFKMFDITENMVSLNWEQWPYSMQLFVLVCKILFRPKAASTACFAFIFGTSWYVLIHVCIMTFYFISFV